MAVIGDVEYIAVREHNGSYTVYSAVYNYDMFRNPKWHYNWVADCPTKGEADDLIRRLTNSP